MTIHSTLDGHILAVVSALSPRLRPIPANLFYNIPLVGNVRNIVLRGHLLKFSIKSMP